MICAVEALRDHTITVTGATSYPLGGCVQDVYLGHIHHNIHVRNLRKFGLRDYFLSFLEANTHA